MVGLGVGGLWPERCPNVGEEETDGVWGPLSWGSLPSAILLAWDKGCSSGTGTAVYLTSWALGSSTSSSNSWGPLNKMVARKFQEGRESSVNPTKLMPCRRHSPLRLTVAESGQSIQASCRREREAPLTCAMSPSTPQKNCLLPSVA